LPISLTFYGAADDVTGSCYVVRSNDATVLVDFGMFQGQEEKDNLNEWPKGLNPKDIDAVLVTHAHLDHTGRLPLLSKHGYAGPVYCTEPTAELAMLILRDSVRLQAQDLERVNRKRTRAGMEPVGDLYDTTHVEALLERFKSVTYDEKVPVAKGMRAQFVDAGHLLGSSSIRLLIEDGGVKKSVVFSGDLGQTGTPILKDPEGFTQADTIILESTYGDRDHRSLEETADQFEAIVREASGKKGKILVPTFAVGRAQLILYLLAVLFRQKRVPKFPVFIDSPMAIEATKIYARHLELFDEDFQRLRRDRPILQDMDMVTPTPTADDSRALNDVKGPCLIMAGSGMCSGGRILHHLKYNLWRPDTDVVIVGFQSYGTLGRRLVEGAESVRILGEEIAVKARLHTLNGFSAHAGQSDLLKWIEPLSAARPQTILTHGEHDARLTLAGELSQRFSLTPLMPTLGETITIT
jgi:metallo-beta-lactamase family protein